MQMLGFWSLKVMRPFKLCDADYATAIMTSTGKVNAIVNYVVQPGAEVAVSEVTEVPDPPTIKANHRRLSNVKITLKSLRAPVTDLPPNRHSDSDSDSDSGSLGLIVLEAQHGKPDRWLALKTHLNDDGLRWREGDVNMPPRLSGIRSENTAGK